MSARQSLWNISNLLSFGRLLLTAPAIGAVLADRKDLAVMLFIVAALSDFLDGWFARRLDQTSNFGRALDPVADKVFVAGVAVALLAGGYVPVWFIAPILIRDALILAGGLYVRQKTSVLLESTWTGKWTVGAISFSALLFYLELNEPIEIAFALIALGMVLLSFLQYIGNARRALAGRSDS